MPFALVQGHGASSATSSTTFANTLGSAVGSGNCVVGIFRWFDDASQTITSVTDNQGNTYNLGSKVTSGAGGTAAQIFWRGNITNAPTIITVTMSAAITYYGSVISEYSGVFAATDPKDVAPAGNTQVGIGTGTDNIVSGNITTATAGCLIWGATDAYSGDGNFPGTGTGFTTGTTFDDQVTVGMTTATEYLTQGAAGSIGATFSALVISGGQNTFVLALKPAVAAAIAPSLLLGRGGPLRSMRGPRARFNAPMLAASLPLEITGTLAATEAIDVAAFAGDAVISAALAATEAIDTAAFTGSVVVSGTLAATDVKDTASFTGSVVVSGTLAATEAIDTAIFAGSIVVSGTLAATEAIDAASFTGTVGTVISGTLAATEAIDTAAFTGSVLIAGTLAATEAQDVAAFGNVAVTVTGTLAANEAGVSLSNYSFFESSAIGFVIGNLSITGVDTAVFNGSVGVSGTLAATEAKDVAAFAGTFPNVIFGTLAANEVGISSTNYSFPANSAVNFAIGTLSVVGIDLAIFNGAVGVNGVLSATEAKDVALFNGQSIPFGISGQLAATEAKDISAFSGAVTGVSGQLTATEARDTAAFNGTVVNAGQLDATEAPDTAAFNGVVFPLSEIFGILAATDARDTANFTGRIGDEEFPADFAHWKFGQRFDRSLTRRFPWQDGSSSRMR